MDKFELPQSRVFIVDSSSSEPRRDLKAANSSSGSPRPVVSGRREPAEAVDSSLARRKLVPNRLLVVQGRAVALAYERLWSFGYG